MQKRGRSVSSWGSERSPCGVPRNIRSNRRADRSAARTGPVPRGRSSSTRCRACSALCSPRARLSRGGGNRGSAAVHGANLSARRTPAPRRSTRRDSRTPGRLGLCRSTPLPYERSPGEILCREVKRLAARPRRSRRHEDKTPSAAAVSRSPSASPVFGRQRPSREAFIGFTQARNTSAGRAGAMRTPGGGPSTEVSDERS